MTQGALLAPQALAVGLRSLRAQPSCAITGEVIFQPESQQWAIPVTLEISAAGEFVEKKTHWYFLVDATYPYGGIGVYPAIKDGLIATFPHQSRNSAYSKQVPWRSGKLCLDSPFRGERRTTVIVDPVGDADERLRWHAQRALMWLEAASTNRLLALGDPFELPERPSDPKSFLYGKRVIHDEPADGLRVWSRHIGSWGHAKLGVIPAINDVYAVASFTGTGGTSIREWSGRTLDIAAENLPSAIWWLWPEPIVLQPWYSPGTWGELRCVGKAQGIGVDQVLEVLARRLRGQNKPSVLLLGYPVPKYVGDEPTEVHWDAIHLPLIPAAKGRPAPGYRTNDRGWWLRDRQGVLNNNAELRPLKTENWHSDRLQARGRLPQAMRTARMAVIGVGALGSAVAELLVRAGVTRLTLIDPEILIAGNICRHQATLNDVGKGKAKVVARKLYEISPHVAVNVIDVGLPVDQNAMTRLIDEIDVVIECTGSNAVLQLLAGGWWSLPKVFASFSLGHAARRLFSFGVVGNDFPCEEFEERMAVWLTDETEKWVEGGEVLEGAGCWSPLFPARHDDVILASAVCVKEVEALVNNLPLNPQLRVFEQAYSSSGFNGFTLTNAPLNDD
ncbi:Molybdopterin-synthase adenylyltransferase [compost metagenome]